MAPLLQQVPQAAERRGRREDRLERAGPTRHRPAAGGGVHRHPVDLTGDGGAVEGSLTIRGVSQPLRLQLVETAPAATGDWDRGPVAHGIKPYTAFFGALKVRDAVDVEVEATIPPAAS